MPEIAEQVMTIDLGAESLIVSGPRGSGRTSLLDTMANAAQRTSNVIRVAPRTQGVETSIATLRAILDGNNDAEMHSNGTCAPTLHPQAPYPDPSGARPWRQQRRRKTQKRERKGKEKRDMADLGIC